MGVYIPDMDMPKDCSYCILANKHINGLCEAKYYCRLEADDFEHCPLIKIPDALVSAWEDYKQTAQIIGKVGRKTFAHKVFELEEEE